jgi:hypothetical protein
VVIGVDPVATGRVAVALARIQAMKRRVAVGDLFAESPPIQELVHTDDPHGLVDSFLYGVSLSRIAYEVPGAGQLFVMPSGTEPPVYEEMLPNPRWHRLTAGFREVGALLVLAAPASAPHIETLVSATDGAILVGEGVPRTLPVALVLGSIREPRAEAAAEAARAERIAAPRRRWSSRRVAAVAGVVMTLSLAAVAAWLATRPFAETHRRLGGKPDTTKGISAVIPAVTPDTAVKASGADTTTAPATTVAVPQVTNPADSTQIAGYSVELMAANTQAGAILKLLQDGKKMPAATFSPFLDASGARWYKVISGAFVDERGADSLLAGFRRQKVVEAGGSVRWLPYAFRIDSGVPAAAVPGMIAQYADRQQPVYALRQADGTAWLLVGAFESLDQSGLYAETLRASGVKPVLVYRKGRMF